MIAKTLRQIALLSLLSLPIAMPLQAADTGQALSDILNSLGFGNRIEYKCQCSGDITLNLTAPSSMQSLKGAKGACQELATKINALSQKVTCTVGVQTVPAADVAIHRPINDHDDDDQPFIDPTIDK